MGMLYDIFKNAAVKQGDKTALIAGQKSYSYSVLLQSVDKWARDISTKSQERPRAALLCEDALHTAGLSIALARLDGCCIPTNTQMTPDQLVRGWKACDVNLILYEPVFQSKIDNLGDMDVTCLSTDDLKDVSINLPDRFAWSEEPDFLITLSSGSTGEPKPIMISQEVKAARAKQAWDMYGLNSNDIMLCASPFFHSMGQRLTYTPLLLGATMVHLGQFSPKAWLDLVATHKVTYTTSVSSHLYALKDSLLNNASQLQSLKTIVTSSAPIDANFKDELFHAIGCDFHEIYGATEIACASNLFPKDAQEKYASVGTLCRDISVRILDEDKSELPSGETGEIAVKSPLAFEGYYKRNDLTAPAWHDGFFLTGDLGFIDEDGFLSYVSRKKDVIISGGINIYPADIENALSQDKNLQEVAVIGVDDKLLGEVIVAICVGDIEEKNLRQIANRQLAPFQRPLKYFFVNKLPLTASGKLSKQALRDEYADKNDGWTDTLRFMLYRE
jgi:acyl-CoA synthetase (AMP-forming)/AMP-acid ligase II